MLTSPTSLVTAYCFGPFRLVIADRILERNGEHIHLTPKVIDTLFVLIENAPHIVSKEAIMQAVWPDVTVVESGLTRNISVLRKALESGIAAGPCLETIPRRGYRFVADVIQERRLPPAITPPVPAPRSIHHRGTLLQIATGTALAILLGTILLHAVV